MTRSVKHIDGLPEFHASDLNPLHWYLGLVIILAASLALSMTFMRYQVVHADETTQLSGLTLTPPEIVKWLVGENPGRFGVPSDRMPPLAYLVQKAWSEIAGSSILTYRIHSLLFSFIGLVTFSALVRRVSPNVLGLGVIAMLALSMNYVQYSVLIRPYPMFFMIGCITCYLLYLYIEARHSDRILGWLFGLTLVCIAACYTHFYGVIMALAIQAALALLALIERRSIRPHVLAVFVTAVCCIGLYPFFMASVDVKTSLPYTVISDFPKLLYRLVASRASAVYAPVQVLLLLGIAVAVNLSSLQLCLSAFKSCRPLGTTISFRLVILVTVVLALSASIAGAIMTSGFNTFEAHYHIWLLPFIYALLLLPTSGMKRQLLRLHTLAVASACVATVASAIVLFQNMTVFVSGPSGALQQVIMRLPAGTPVIYDNKYGDPWYFGSYPVHFLFAGKVQQYLVDTSASDMNFMVASGNSLIYDGRLDKVSSAQAMNGKEFIILAQIENFFVEQSIKLIRNGEPSIADEKRDQKFADHFGYEVVERGYHPGYSAARIAVLKRKPQPL
jgi:Dolichyl-phosphate-mannose-protein mannosyltransferase